MRYTVEIQIKKPKEAVFKLFEDPENLYKWQPSLEKIELLSGTAGQPGAKSKLTYLKNGKPFEMIETITNITGSDEFIGTYESKGIFNIVKSRFFDDHGHTKLVLDSEFRFSGFMVLVSLFIKGTCVKQTTDMLNGLKKFAESSMK